MKDHKIDSGRLAIAFSFLVIVLILTLQFTEGNSNHLFLAIAAVFGGYMAMNIGANDVANNVGPAVGAKALTMTMAIIIAMIFEAGGAFIAGGEVISTIKKGIIDIDAFGQDTDRFLWAMMSALLAAALWLNLATVARAPVSTTHSIVGGVMGAGIAAAGFDIVDWGTMGKIASSWVISPVIGGMIAALFLFAIKKTIIFKTDKISASYRWVPVYVAIMAWAFITYLILKGLKKVTKKPTFAVATMLGAFVAVVVFCLVKQRLKSTLNSIENDRDSVNILFTIPLIFAAALLSFAHGANDVANAIGPLAAINDAVMTGGISAKAGIPLWVMAIGAFGIAIGLALYGPRLIKTVGTEITDLDQVRAFSVAMAAAITVIIASQLGLPVSSTHITIGGIFGVGLLRQWLDNKQALADEIEREQAEIVDDKIQLRALNEQLTALESKLARTEQDELEITRLSYEIDNENQVIKVAKKALKNDQKRLYIQQGMIQRIITAWLITVPSAAVLSAAVFHIIEYFLA
ncbi:UNVERIFIED_CONTAM: hypothetical protein GTU68_026764 [Idotea baltica]|nr:hypothetical protein [Idotea baltica]